MENHPTSEKLELLLKGKLKGNELIDVLRHLEICDDCFDKLPQQDPQKIIQNLFADDDDEDSELDDESKYEISSKV